MTEQTSTLEVLFLPVSINLLFKHTIDIRVQAYLRLPVTDSKLVTVLQHKPNSNVAHSVQ